MRLDRRTAIKLRDKPETVTSHWIYDMVFFNCAFAFARIAESKGITEQANAMVMVMVEEMVADHKVLNK